MNEYKLNYQLSKEIFGTNRDNFKPNQCYNNTFLLVSNRNIDTNRIKIVYGFIYRKDINRGHIELYNELLNQEIQLHNKLVSRDYHRNFGELGEFLERVYNKDLMKGLNEYKINKGIIKK